ncbi:MAG TPA: sensor domain-containing diguanylate cyclase [Solirubrobacteraceae bacterium]|nr:sensor domain-containing diguanylate cyclase [Solirubrobacteraceae bacterium]
MAIGLSANRLLAIIETQNQIAAPALDLDAVMELVVQRAGSLTDANATVLELADGDEMVSRAGAGAAAERIGLRRRIDSSFSGLCVRLGTTLHCRDASGDHRVDLEACRRVGAMSMVCVPLTHDDRVIGVLKVYDPVPNAFTSEDIATLDLLSEVIASHMAQSTDSAQQFHGSRHDALTGLPNRRALDERLTAEVSRVQRHDGQLALVLLDLDRFKQATESLGDPAGDAVLRAVARNLSRRAEDGAYRVGGDEFALVLVEAGADGARAVMTRIVQMIATDPDCGGVVACWGVASYVAGDVPGGLLQRADAALYDAKHQVAVAPTAPPPS